MQLKNILTILDKPKHPQHALSKALALQDLSQAHLECVAFTWHPLVDYAELHTGEDTEALQRRLQQSREAEIGEEIVRYQADGRSLSLTSVWSDDIADWVMQRQHIAPCDLVIKTINQSKTLMHTPLDWALLRTSSTPVLLAPQHTGDLGRKAPVVLAALDLRHQDEVHQRLNQQVLSSAAYFSKLYGIPLHGVAALPFSRVLHDLEIFDEHEMRRKAKAAFSERLPALTAETNVELADMHFPAGPVGKAVNRVADQVQASLLVVGTSTRRVKQALGVGNSAEQILLGASCDVLAVHP